MKWYSGFKRHILPLVIAFSAAQAHAGGFQVNLQSVTQVGMGHTGAALLLDPSAQLFNPGGMALSRSGISGNFTPIFGRVSYLAPAPSTYTASNEPTMSTPFAVYGSLRRHLSGGHDVAVGLCSYTPFGSRVLYADDWKGQFALREISVKAIFNQFSLGYAYKNKIGIGGSIVYATGNVAVRKAIPAQFQDGSYGEANLSGAANGLGWTAGLFVWPTQRLSIGLNHRSKVTFAADAGDATFNVPADLAEFFPNTTFSSSLPMPATTTLGLAFRYGPQSFREGVVCVDLSRVGWSAYRSLAFDFATNTDKLADSDSPRNYKNAWIYRLGWQQGLAHQTQVRAGVFLDMTPVPDGHTTPETPDANKLGFSVGASKYFGDFRIDAAFLWVEGFKRTDINTELNFGGTWKARALIPCIGVAWLPVFQRDKSTPAPLIED